MRCRDAGIDGLIIDAPYFDAAVEILGLPKTARIGTPTVTRQYHYPSGVAHGPYL